MDSGALVEGGLEGLERIVSLLEQRGVHVSGAYLLSETEPDGFEDVSLRLVTSDDRRDVLFKYAALRGEGLLPRISEEVTISPVQASNPEAARILDYARNIGHLPVFIRGVVWKGLYIDDAIVIRYPQPERAVV